MKICRLYTGLDNQSHFDDIDISLNDCGDIGKLSKAQPASGVIFRENDPDYDYDWHNAPCRQFVILLNGEIEIEVGSGETRQFQGGDIILAEDITGQGHRSRQLSENTRQSIFIQIPD